MATFEDLAKKRDVKGMILTALLTALSFVVGLFWNDAIRSGIETVIPFQERVTAKFMAAFVVTLVAIFAAWTVIRTYEFSETAAKEWQRLIQERERLLKKRLELMKKEKELKKKRK
jgi:prepilin signal peptidase PulO-like enzyme (type II secretory pathway)